MLCTFDKTNVEENRELKSILKKPTKSFSRNKLIHLRKKKSNNKQVKFFDKVKIVEYYR